MSFLDPLGIEELKKKKTNIFDLSGGFSSQSTQSPQAPTSAPRDQYMTPVPKATQFSYNPVPNYSEGVVSPAARNIFESQQFKTQFQEEAKNPYTPAAKAMQQFKFDRQAEYQKGIIGGIDDILAGMPEDQLPVLYKDIDEKDRTSILDVTADIRSGMPIKEIYKLYPELSYTVKNYLNDKYGETFTQAIGLDKARQRLTDNSGSDSAWNLMRPVTEGLADVFYGLAKGAENISQGSIGVLNNAQGNVTPKKLNQNLLQLGQGVSASAFTVLFPNATKVFSIAAQTPVINNITNAMGFINDGIGRIGNYAPGLAEFRDSFETEEEKKQFDALIGSVITFGLMKSTEIKSGPIRNMNKFVQSKISSAISPLSKLVNDYLKSKSPYETVAPTPGSASARYADFVRYAASKGYNVPKGQEAQGYQNFQKIFKGEGEPQQSYTTPEPTVQEPVNPASPFNQGYDSQGQATVRPQPQRNSKIDDMIMKTIAPSVRNIKTAPQLDMFKQKTFGGLQTLLANREATPYLFDPEGNIDYNNTTLSNASQATNDAMFDVWNTQIKPMIDEATIAGATIDSTPMVTAIMDAIKGFKLSDGTVIPGMETAYQNMMKWINIFMDQEGNLKKINLDDAQIISQSLNKQAKPLYQGSSAGDIITLFAIDGLNKILRPLLDEAVTKFLGIDGLSEGKRIYGELANLQPYLTKRGIVADRQKPVGLFDGLGDIYSGTEIAGAIGKLVTGDFGGFVSSIARAGASKFIGKLLKQTNNNNRMFADLLKEIDKQTNGFRYKGGIKNIAKPQAPWQAKYSDTAVLPATAEPTVIGPQGPRVNVPNTPERTIPVQKTIRETYGPNYENPVDKKNAEVKKSLLRKKEQEDAARESIKQNQESERLAKKAEKEKEILADFEKAKNNGYQLSDSNAWKSGDVSKLGTLDGGIILDGTVRVVKIDGIKYPESVVRPVYREKREIEQRNFGDMKNQWIKDGLEILEVKDINDLPKEFQDRLLEIANQGAKGDMGKLADKINVMIDDWKKYNRGGKFGKIIDTMTDTTQEEVAYTPLTERIPSDTRLEENAVQENRLEAIGSFEAGYTVHPISAMVEEQAGYKDALSNSIKSIKEFGAFPLSTEFLVYKDAPVKKTLITKDGQTEKKEYNSDKKTLISKKDTNDGSKLQTEQGNVVGYSNGGKDLSIPSEDGRTSTMTTGENPRNELNRGYTSDNADIGDGPRGTIQLSKTEQSKLNQNVISVIESKNFSTDPKDYTPEQIQDMLKYEGGGGLSKKEGDTSGSNDEFYTPENVINVMRDIAKKYGFKEYAEVLEPSAGVGRFLRNKPEWIGRSTGMEIDKISGTIAKITNPGSKIVIGDFQDQFMDFTKTKPLSESEIKDLPKFDVVIGNPPYKERTTIQRKMGDLKEVNRFEDYFMIRGIDRLKNGGTMVVIVPSAFMDKGLYSAKQIILDKGGILVDAYRLPNKTFPNTDVGTDILVFKKTGSILESESVKNKYLMADGERFRQNPSKILGEVGERTNRFGKMEKFIKGDASNLSKIMLSEPKPQTELQKNINELGPLTITNIVTGKKEIIDTPAPVVVKNELGIQRQKGTSPVVNMTNTILDIVESNGGLKDGYMKVKADGFMDLYIEKIGNKEIAVAHTYIQNGDVMRDPEVVFEVSPFGSLKAKTIQNDPYGIKEITPNDEFLDIRADNLREQGFIKEAMQPVEKTTDMLTNERELLIRDKKELDRLTNYTKQFPGTKKPPQIKTLEGTIYTREKMIEYIEKQEPAIVESKQTLIAKKTTETVKVPVEKKIELKTQKIEPSKAINQSLFDMPTEKQAVEISKNILKPVEVVKGTSNRIFNEQNIPAGDLELTLKYQNLTNVFGEVEGVMVGENPKLLNYMDGKTFQNYEYFSGDIYQKLEQLELDRNNISEDQYNKQKTGLEARLPEQQTIENIHFDPRQDHIMNMDTNELHTVREYQTNPLTNRSEPKDVEKFMKIGEKFKIWLREEGIPGRARVSAYEIISFINKGRIDVDRKAIIQEDSIYYLNKFIKDVLDPEMQRKIMEKHNKTNRSVVPMNVKEIPLVVENMSDTFRGRQLTLKEVQIESILKAATKGTYIAALGVGYGKTMVGIVATVVNMQKGLSKRPIFVVPGQTMQGWVETIQGLFPSYKINNLGTLDTKARAKAYAELGKDTSKWIEDNTITIMTHSAFENQLSFKKATQDKITSQFLDDMATDDMSSKQIEALSESTEATVGAAATKRGGGKTNFSMFDKDFLTEQFEKMENMNHDQFIKDFVESDSTKNPLAKMKAEEMRAMKPIYMEDLGFDAITVDEIHNFKNVFSKAKIAKEEKNMYGDIQGSSSKRGMKMTVATNYILENNNGRGVIGLTATPFNNQAIEVYNILNFVARARLKKLGITNMNDFMSMFSEFKEELVVKPSGTDVVYKMAQKNFVNLQDLQRLISEFIDFKGDSPEIIKPELVNKIVKLQFSELQREVQDIIEDRIDKNANKGDVIGGQQEARANVVSPYFTQYAPKNPTALEFMKNSPKIDFFADMIIEKNKLGNKDGAIMFVPTGVEFHELIREGISLRTGIPESKIGIINGTAKYKSKMVETANKFNKGEYEILIGGSNINEGIDLQHKTYIMYDTLLGWNPTVKTQKDGRGRRQGNMRNYVVSVLPLMENSVDSVMLQKMEEKQSRINDIFSAEGEVFSTEDIDPSEEKLALMTNPIKKAKIAINIEQRKLQKSIEMIKGDISELERHKSNLESELNTLPKLFKTIDEYKARTYGDMGEYIKKLEKEIKSIEGKAERSREKLAKGNIDLESELRIKTMELEQLQNEYDSIGSTIEQRIKQFEIDQVMEMESRKDRRYYLDDINNITKNLKVFENAEEQATFKKSLLGKK